MPRVVAEGESLAVLDVFPVSERGTHSISFGLRSSDLDWAPSRWPQKVALRFEWPSRVGELSRNWLDFDAPELEPVPWVDVIAQRDDRSLVRVRFHPGDEGPRPVACEVRAAPGDALTSTLRRAGMVDVLDAIDSAFAENTAVRGVLGSTWRRPVARPGRRGTPDAIYAEKALRYVAALEAAPRSPVSHLIADAKEDSRYETAAMWRAWLNRARVRGLLTEAPAGKAGGQLTPKAKKILGITGGRKKR